MLDELAAEMRLSPSRLRALVKDDTGQPFMQYAKWRRLEKAWALVVGSFLQVTEIAAQLGYEDTSHFTREFKQTFGLPPRAYRRFVTKIERNHHRPEIVTTGIAADGPVFIITPVR